MMIAQISTPKALACAACMVLFAAFPWWAILTGLTGSDGLEAAHDWVIWLLLFLSPWMMLVGLTFIWFMLSPSSHCVRISDGLLFYPGAAPLSFLGRFRFFFRKGFSAFRRDDCTRSIPLADITGFSIGTLQSSGLAELAGFAFVLAALFSHETPPAPGGGNAKGIFAHIKDGQRVHISAYLVDQPRDVILARLNQALADSQR